MPPKLTIKVVEGPGFRKVNFTKIMEVLGTLLVAEVTGINEGFSLTLAEPPNKSDAMTLHVTGGNNQVLFQGSGVTEEACALSLLEDIGRKYVLTPRIKPSQRTDFLTPPEDPAFETGSYGKLLH